VKKLRFSISIRVLKIALFFFILLSIVVLLKDVDFKQTLPILKNIDYVLLIGVFLLSGASIFFVSWRWYFLLQATKKNISFKNVTIATISGIAINASGPGKLGIPAKAILIKKMEGVEVNESLPSLMMELFLELFALGVLLVGSALANGMHSILMKLLINSFTNKNFVAIGGLVLISVGIVYVFRHKLAAGDFAGKMLRALRATLARKDIFVAGLIVSFLNLLVSYWGDQLLFKALGQEISYSFIAFSSAFANLAGMLSPMPSGLGVWELSRAYLFKTYYGIGELAVVMTLMRRLLTYVAMGILYLGHAVFIARRSLPISAIAEEQGFQASLKEIE
jgi:uncharacterized membrane protein YbhN (UPF0104 family)